MPDPNNSEDAYLSVSGFTAVTGVGHVFRTTDFGTTWAREDGFGGTAPLPDVPVIKMLVDRRDVTGNTVLAGTDIGIFSSSDGGGAWAPYNLANIPKVPVIDLEQNFNGLIFAGTHGRGAYQLLPNAAFTAGTIPIHREHDGVARQRDHAFRWQSSGLPGRGSHDFHSIQHYRVLQRVDG